MKKNIIEFINEFRESSPSGRLLEWSAFSEIIDNEIIDIDDFMRES